MWDIEGLGYLIRTGNISIFSKFWPTLFNTHVTVAINGIKDWAVSSGPSSFRPPYLLSIIVLNMTEKSQKIMRILSATTRPLNK